MAAEVLVTLDRRARRLALIELALAVVGELEKEGLYTKRATADLIEARTAERNILAAAVSQITGVTFRAETPPQDVASRVVTGTIEDLEAAGG